MFIYKVQTWSEERGLHTTSHPEIQFIKLIEEIGELADAKTQGEFIDAIGDSLIVMAIISQQNDIEFRPILATAELRAMIPSDTVDKWLWEINSALGQLARSYCRMEKPDLAVSLQRITTALGNMGAFHGITLMEALDHAYYNIRDRKGVLNAKGALMKDGN